MTETELLALSSPALVLVADKRAGSRSRFGGGEAWLPEGEEWPAHEGDPLTLLVQVDLAEAHAAAPGLDALPPEGLLQAFCDLERFWQSGPLGSVPTVRLFLHGPESKLVRRRGPGLPERPVGMRYEVRPTLAPDDLPEDDQEAWTNPMHQMLGYPYPVQDDPLRYPTDNEADPLWVLALQLGSDSGLGWCFGDAGNLYFLADGAAFQKGRIEKAHFEFQCY